MESKKWLNKLVEEYSGGIPDYFDDADYIPTKEEYDNFTDEQKDYIYVSVNTDLIDMEDSSLMCKTDKNNYDRIIEKLKNKLNKIKQYRGAINES